MSDLAKKKCKPCEGGVEPFTAAGGEGDAEGPEGLDVEDGKLAKIYPFRTTTRPWRS